jgi:hypothetical protein
VKSYLTFRSTVTNPQVTDAKGKKVFKPREYAQIIHLYEALSVEFEAKGKPRMYFPIACWGFPLDINRVNVLLLLESEQETTSDEALTFQIAVFAWRLWLGNFIFSKKITKATKAVETAIEKLVGSDKRFSDLKQFDRDQKKSSPN